MKRFFLILLSIIAIFNLLLWPKNKYEWMEDEGMTVLPEDGNAQFYILFAAVPIVILIFTAFFANTKLDKVIFLSLGALMFFYWIFKFYI